jgi:hypothetical protein
VPSEASELNLFTGLRASEQRPQCLEDRRPIVGYAEVGPVKVIVWPWRLPAAVKVEPIIRLTVTGVRIECVEGRRGDSVAVGQFHRIQVLVHLVLPVLVTLLGALGWLGAEKPEHLSFRAGHDHTGLAHLDPFVLLISTPLAYGGSTPSWRTVGQRPRHTPSSAGQDIGGVHRDATSRAAWG